MVGRGSRMDEKPERSFGTFEWAIACANTTMRAEPFVPDVPCPKSSSSAGASRHHRPAGATPSSSHQRCAGFG